MQLFTEIQFGFADNGYQKIPRSRVRYNRYLLKEILVSKSMVIFISNFKQCKFISQRRPCRLRTHIRVGTRAVAVFVVSEMKQSPADFLLHSQILFDVQFYETDVIDAISLQKPYNLLRRNRLRNARRHVLHLHACYATVPCPL